MTLSWSSGEILEPGIEVSGFKLPLRYYVHFHASIQVKDTNPYPSNYTLNCITVVLLEG